MLAWVLAVPLLLAPVAATPPAPTVACRGDEPSWSLRIAGDAATLAVHGFPSRALDGRLVESRGNRLPFLVYRAKAGADGDLVALITAEACRDAAAAQSGSGEISTHTAALLGPLAAGTGGLLAAQRAELAWNEGDYSVRREASTPVRVSEIAFSDGLTCRSAGAGGTIAFGGRRAAFTCGTLAGARVVVLGDLEPVEGGFRATRARVVTGAGGFSVAGEESLLVTMPR
jgi:hypothetical protein